MWLTSEESGLLAGLLSLLVNTVNNVTSCPGWPSDFNVINVTVIGGERG